MMESVTTELNDLIAALNTHEGDVVLYGAGAYGEKTYNMLASAGYKVAAFCDGSPAKVGQLYMTKPIISIEQLAEMDNYIVIIAVLQTHHKAICENLLSMNVKNIYAVSLPQLKLSQLMSILPPEHLVIDVDDIQLKKIAYRKLKDEDSKTNYVAWLYDSLTGDKTIYEEVGVPTNKFLTVPLRCPDLTTLICTPDEAFDDRVTLSMAADKFILWEAM